MTSSARLKVRLGNGKVIAGRVDCPMWGWEELEKADG